MLSGAKIMIEKPRSWWKALRPVERTLIVAALLILLLAAHIAVWAG